MEKNIRFLLFAIFFLQTKITKCDIFKAKEIFKVAMHWVLSAGPQYADAIYQFSLLSDDYAYEIFGNEEADFITQNFIRRILEECGVDYPEMISIKNIKLEAQRFVVSAITCTQTTIFINNSIFDFLSKNEQRIIIAQAAILIKRKHIQKNVMALTLIPIVTYIVTESYASLCDYLYHRLPRDTKQKRWVKTVRKRKSVACKILGNKISNKFYACRSLF